MRIRHSFPIIKTEQYDWFMTTINTALGFDSNDKATLKLQVIEVFERSGLAVTQRAFPGISNRTIYRWRKRYIESGKRLFSLLPISTRPRYTQEKVCLS